MNGKRREEVFIESEIDLFQTPYESPILLDYEPPKFDIDGAVVKAVQNVGILVNKEQLECIIKGDRQRYEAAYRAGYNAAKAECEATFAAIADIAQKGAKG